MSSRRIYITLNDENEKDKVIINLLSSAYSEKDYIKDLLYRVATNCTETVQLNYFKNNKNELNETKCTETVQKDNNYKNKSEMNETKCTETVQLSEEEMNDLKMFYKE